MARSFGRLVIKALKEKEERARRKARARDKEARQAVIVAGKKALEKRVKARDRLCKRYMDSAVDWYCQVLPAGHTESS